jgi:hypothetical protein
MNPEMQQYPSWAHEVLPVLGAIQIESPTSFLFRGTRIDAANQPPAHLEDPCFNLDPLFYLLHRHIYTSFHMGVEAGEGDLAVRQLDAEALDAGETDIPTDDSFQQKLLDAYGGQAHLSRGWKVLIALNGGEVCAQKAHRVRVWRPGQYLFDGAPARAAKGASVHVLLRKNSLTLQSGFYHAFGSFVADEQSEGRAMRFYLNARHAGAAEVARLVCGTFDARGVPFQFKCLSGASDYVRRDSAVLYMGKRYARVAVDLLGQLYPHLRGYLRAETPMLAKPLAPGLALAEDPDADDSFGTHRTRAIAEGLYDAFRHDRHTEAERLAAVLRAFEAQNISTEKPHLNAKPDDPFGLDLLELPL